MQLCGSMQGRAQSTKKCARKGCRKMMTKALVERLRKSSEKFVWTIIVPTIFGDLFIKVA
jgi:hypothetical protein